MSTQTLYQKAIKFAGKKYSKQKVSGTELYQQLNQCFQFYNYERRFQGIKN